MSKWANEYFLANEVAITAGAWLKKKTSIERLEEAGFRDSFKPWSQFKACLEEGDELWEFKSPPETWQNLCGRAGICIVRGGEMMDMFVTALN